MADLLTVGQAVSLKRNTETNLIDPRILQPGDLLFFSRSGDTANLHQMAICITQGSIMIENQGRSSIRLVDPAKDESLWQTLIAVRRLFPQLESQAN
jgi:cell wall-associated NlpC family hydrolase